MLREKAWIELETEPPEDETEKLMDDEQFDEEARLAGEGRWDEIGLDDLPENWQTASVEEFRDAG